MAAWPLLWRYRALCDFAFGGVVLYAFVRFLVSKCAGAVLTVRRPLRELFELASGGSGGAEQLRGLGVITASYADGQDGLEHLSGALRRRAWSRPTERAGAFEAGDERLGL